MIGIFWIYKFNIYAKSINKAQIQSINGFVDSDFAHYLEWDKISLKNKELYLYEYEDIPRGRVVYNINESQFIVYCNENILKDTTSKKLIIKEFQLVNKNFVFKEDEHYKIL